MADDPRADLLKALGARPGKRSARRFEEAAAAFRSERFADARKLVAPVAKAAPDIADVRELHGLALYRLGRFGEAMAELEAFRQLSGSTEQHPVLADCHRALRHWDEVDSLWAELGAASPSAELVTEGMIVTAGARADRGDLSGAIRMLERGWRISGRKDWKLPRNPRPHHLRRAYALADLYERAGRPPGPGPGAVRVGGAPRPPPSRRPPAPESPELTGWEMAPPGSVEPLG